MVLLIGVAGLLLAVLAVAVQASRERARRAVCADNLREWASAVLLHEQDHDAFPVGGWGGDWVGDPDRGIGSEQPGGWVYNTLPYTEHALLRDWGAGMAPAQKARRLGDLQQTPLSSAVCPSRRRVGALPYRGSPRLLNAEVRPFVAKTDYAISVRLSHRRTSAFMQQSTEVRGVSRTVLVGEKSVAARHYLTGNAPGDRLSIFCGDAADIRRDPGLAALPDYASSPLAFGGAHVHGCLLAYCDGSVRLVAFGAVPEAFGVNPANPVGERTAERTEPRLVGLPYRFDVPWASR